MQWKGVSARLVPTQYEKLAHVMLVFSPSQDMTLDFKSVVCEILKSGLSNDMHYISKLSFTFDVSFG